MIGDVLFGPLAAAVKSALTDLPPPSPAEGYCSDALALALGGVAVALAAAAFLWAAIT